MSHASELELQNLHLKEALQYAKRGWEDALALLNKEKEAAAGPSNNEAAMEISALQMEIDALHKSINTRAQGISTFKSRLMLATNTLISTVEDIRSLVKCPLPEEDMDAKFVEELSYGLDENEEQLNAYLGKVESSSELLNTVKEFISSSSEPYDNGEHNKHETGTGSKKGVLKKKKKETKK